MYLLVQTGFFLYSIYNLSFTDDENDQLYGYLESISYTSLCSDEYAELDLD